MALAFHAMGFREHDIVLNTFSYHLVPGGHGFDQQLATAGCAVIPAGPQNTDLQAQILAGAARERATSGTPTFLKLLCDKADELGIVDAGGLVAAGRVRHGGAAARSPSATSSRRGPARGFARSTARPTGSCPRTSAGRGPGCTCTRTRCFEVLDPETWAPVRAGDARRGGGHDGGRTPAGRSCASPTSTWWSCATTRVRAGAPARASPGSSGAWTSRRRSGGCSSTRPDRRGPGRPSPR